MTDRSTQLGRRRRTAVGACGSLAAVLVLSVTGGPAAGATPAAATPSSAAAPVASGTSPSAPAPSGDLTTYGYGNDRSGTDATDPTITSLSAAPAWHDSLGAAVYGQPLVDGATVYVGTERDRIDAIAAATGQVDWSLQVGTPVSTSVIDSAPTLSSSCGNIDPLGITGTPVIDPSTDELFVAEETVVGSDRWQDVQHWLVAVSLSTHRELWHRVIDPPGANDRHDYYVAAEQQRPALTLLDGRIYVEFGGLIGDCGTYHGYVVEIPETGSGPLGSYRVPSQREGAIWETGGLYVSPTGDLYLATGNGSSASLRHFDEGNSVIELSPDLHRLGYWAPANWVQLNEDDWDLGSAGPIGIPGTSLLFVAGKPGLDTSVGYLMRVTPLEGIGRGAFTGRVCSGGGAFGVFGSDATAVVRAGRTSRTYVYVPCGNGTEALEVDAAAMRFTRAWSPSEGAPNGSPLVAGGLVWALHWPSGGLFGMAPTTGKVVVRRSTGPLPHFAVPAVGDGMLVVPTLGGIEAWSTKG